MTRLSSQDINSLESAQVLGVRLGEKIVELSKASSKNHLDKGIIRTLVITKAIPSVADLSPATALINVPESKTSQPGKVSSPVESLPSVEQVQPPVLPADEPDPEDQAPTIETELVEDIIPEVPSTQVIEETEVEDDEEEDEDNEAEEEDEQDEGDEDETATELLTEPAEAIQAEDTTALIATDIVDAPIAAEEPDAGESATEILNSAP
ncbi:hypothetical protein [Leptodesmis sp.]|uniref:hypothetical protein n=1 Tax=Leptodesmis sp. TaxID=3100501 RepID=UPI0040534E9C